MKPIAATTALNILLGSILNKKKREINIQIETDLLITIRLICCQKTLM